MNLIQYVLSSLSQTTHEKLNEDIIRFLTNYPIENTLYHIPLSQIKPKQIERIVFDAISKDLPPNITKQGNMAIKYKRYQLKCNILLNTKLGIIIHYPKSFHDFQIMIGKIWWSYINMKDFFETENKNVILYVYDPMGFFRNHAKSIPPHFQVVLQPKPHIPRKIDAMKQFLIERGGYSYYEARHPAMDKIQSLMGEFESEMAEKIMNYDSPTLDNIQWCLAHFPLERFLQDVEIITPILEKDKDFVEIHVEWLLSLYLQRIYGNKVVNQFRTDFHIFDVYINDAIILEFKYLRSRNEYFRLIGQLWDYAAYNKALILYVYDPKKFFKAITIAFPPNTYIVHQTTPFLFNKN
jgi:hypothetical protein